LKTLDFSDFLWYNFLMENEKEKTTNNTETVTISRAEYAEYKELKLQNQWLLEQLGLAKKRQFGASSEKANEEVMEQLDMTFGRTFNEAEANTFGTKSATQEQIQIKAHARKRQSGSVEDVVPEGTPVEVVEHRLSDEERICAVCGSEMVEIGKEVRRSLKMKPARFWVKEDVYYTYACKNCEKETDEANILKTPKEPVICPGSFASPEAVAHIMAQKFVMYSPLYRLEQEFGRQGLKLSRQTMSNWMLNVTDTWLKPIYDVLHQKLCQEKVLHGDETTLQVLRESGKAATSKSYMWLYRTSGCAEHPIVLYEYQPNRKAENAAEFLKGFSGWLHADGYQGYHKLSENIRVVGCWAHARRKFDEALNALDKDARKGSLAATGECYCSRLFQLEETFAELPPEERYDKRLEQEKPVLDALLAWANETSGKAAPKSALGKALHYLLEQWPYLIRYLEDGRLELSNNRAERSIKPFVMGRKNWLFANTPAGAQSSAVIYSLIETAKESGLDPYRYLLWVLESAPALAQADEDWAEKLIPACAFGRIDKAK
jgi:transposase